MSELLPKFEQIVRRARQYTDARSEPAGGLHPFEERNIHPALPKIVRDLFDDGYYAQSTFEAYKYIDIEVQRHAHSAETGFKLMMRVFDENNPLVRLTPLTTQSEKDEQQGYRFLFAGAVLAIRNPRGHTHTVVDAPDKCLDHLALASLLLRRLEEAGFK